MNKNELQNKIMQRVHFWSSNGKYVIPDLTDCLDFMLTEAAESIDARLRMKSYIRNNPGESTTEAIAVEIFDTIMMGCIALDMLGFDLDEVAEAKLRRMDEKRGLVWHEEN